jgi:hypothetical protein
VRCDAARIVAAAAAAEAGSSGVVRGTLAAAVGLAAVGWRLRRSGPAGAATAPTTNATARTTRGAMSSSSTPATGVTYLCCVQTTASSGPRRAPRSSEPRREPEHVFVKWARSWGDSECHISDNSRSELALGPLPRGHSSASPLHKHRCTPQSKRKGGNSRRLEPTLRTSCEKAQVSRTFLGPNAVLCASRERRQDARGYSPMHRHGVVLPTGPPAIAFVR